MQIVYKHLKNYWHETTIIFIISHNALDHESQQGSDGISCVPCGIIRGIRWHLDGSYSGLGV